MVSFSHLEFTAYTNFYNVYEVFCKSSTRKFVLDLKAMYNGSNLSSLDVFLGADYRIGI